MITAAEQPWPFGTIFPDETGPIEMVVQDRVQKYRATFPPNHGLKYNLTTDLPEIFHYEQYDDAHPLETVVQVKGSGGSNQGGLRRQDHLGRDSAPH